MAEFRLDRVERREGGGRAGGMGGGVGTKLFLCIRVETRRRTITKEQLEGGKHFLYFFIPPFGVSEG